MSLLVFFWKLLPNPIVITNQTFSPNSDIITFSNPDFSASVNITIESDIITFSNPDPDFRTTILPVIDSNISCLRYDDVALISYIKNHLKRNQFDYVNVIDGYPENEQLVLPSVAIEHNLTYNRPFEIGSKNRIYRSFNVYIYARTKGERDEICSCIEDLNNNLFETDDRRINTIISVEHLDNSIKSTKLASIEKKYWTLDFNGINTSSKVLHSNDFNIASFSFDIDVLIPSQTISGSRYLVDKYIDSSRRGFRIFLDNNNRIWFSTGQGSTNTSVFATITSYFDKRTEFSFKQTISGSSCTLQIYINSVLVSSSSFTIPSSFVMGTKDIHIGHRVQNNLNTSHLLFYLYGCRMSSNTSTIKFGRVGEYLRRDSSDLFYLNFDEGSGSISRDKSGNSNNLQALNNYEWTNYLIDNSPGFKYHLSEYSIDIANEDICN